MTETALVEVAKGGGEVRVLTKSEQQLLHTAEATIKKGAEAFIEVGEALMTIRDKRLYRAEFSTFEEYCRRRWGFSKSSANRYIAANTVVGNLQDIDPKVLPAAESQIRPLTLLKPAEQKKVWKRVIEEVKQTHRPLTANIVTRKISETYPEIQTYRKPTQPKRGDRVRLEKETVLEEIETQFKVEEDRLQDHSPRQVVNWVKKVVSAM